MNRITALCGMFLLFALVSCEHSAVGPGPVPTDPLLIHGFSYTSFARDGFTRGSGTGAVADLHQQTANDWIALCVFEYQRNATSHDIAPNETGVNPIDGTPWPTTSTPADLDVAVTDARRTGLKIMLKPHVDLYSGVWRASIIPDSAWFAAYRAMMLKYAQFAADRSIEMLCLGVEYVVATQPQYTASWRALIRSIDSVYHGTLIYAANWSGDYADGIASPEYLQVGFWDQLTYVGIDAYYPVTLSADEPVPSLLTAMSRLDLPVQEVGGFVTSVGKPLLITEIGVQSARGALAQPWDYGLGNAPGAVEDDAAQDLYYRAILETFGRQSWCEGIFWWNWESVATQSERTNYTPRNKPAAATLRQRYGQLTVLN